MAQIRPNSGWHIDAGSQDRYNTKGNKDLYNNNSYKFAKIGIYLQNDSPFGNSISIAPGFHKLHLLRKVLFKLLSSNVFSKIIHKLLVIDLDKSIQPGDLVIFDCRLPHRSSITKKTTNRHKDADLSLSDKSKLVIYFEAGDKSSCETHARNALSRIVQEELYENMKKQDIFFLDFLRFGNKDIQNISEKNSFKTPDRFIPSYELDEKTRNILKLIYNQIHDDNK